MDKSIKKLIRPDLTAFAGYSAATSPETLEGKTDVPVKDIIKLDANENPYGCSPKVSKALARYSNFHVYTDDGQTKLRELLSEYIGLDAGCIVAGSGSNQLIDLVLRLFLNPGDEVISCPPTFGIYGFSTKLCAGNLVEVPRGEHFDINVGIIKAAITKRTKVICLANPNNPTGTVIPQSDILELLDTGIPLLLDEAYYEFCGETLAAKIGSCDNLMILRTFSKWAGLAGLRIGYGLFPPDIADMLMKIKMPYNVNVAAVVAVQESLKDIDYLVGRLQAIVDERNRLFQEIKKLGWLEPLPSQANFLLCQVLKGEARRVAKELQQKGVLVRFFDQPRLRNFIRISVGKPEHTDALLKALEKLG